MYTYYWLLVASRPCQGSFPFDWSHGRSSSHSGLTHLRLPSPPVSILRLFLPLLFYFDSSTQSAPGNSPSGSSLSRPSSPPPLLDQATAGRQLHPCFALPNEAGRRRREGGRECQCSRHGRGAG